MQKAPITTHILDLHKGRPATGVTVELYSPSSSVKVAHGITDSDGRVTLWSDSFEIEPGVWSIKFLINDWFDAENRCNFFADVSLNFKIDDTSEHYHVPLLLNEYGYSTYRGS